MPALLENSRPQPATRFDDGEFVDLGWRPIFKEHTNRLGTKFDRYSMQKIADRCNTRIEKTGDFAPITIGHTTDSGDFDPKVVGFCGPYQAKAMTDGTWAVYAKFRVFKEDEPDVKRYPRCSVEYWASKAEPDAGWFDPVCLLGSETPELDLGIHYSKRGGKQMLRYQAVAPGGANTYVPSMMSDEDKPSRYQGGTLSQDDLQQIVAALQPMIEQTVKVQVAAMNPPGGTDTAELNPLNALDGMDAGGDELDQALAASGEEEANEMSDELDGGLGDPLEGDDEPSEAGPLGDDDDSDVDGDDMPGDDDSDVDDEAGLSAPAEESTPKKKPMKADKAKKPAKEKPDQYSANGRESETVSLEDHMATETPEATVTKYQKQVADLTAERDEYKTKYQKEVESRRTAETDLTTLKGRVDAIEAERRTAVRYQKLFERQSQGYTFELADELKDCEAMTDEQFTKHVDERIPSRYSRVPTPGNTKPMPIPATSRLEQDSQRAAEKRARYSKKAMENCLANSELTFKAEFDRLLAEDPEARKPATSAA